MQTPTHFEYDETSPWRCAKINRQNQFVPQNISNKHNYIIMYKQISVQ